MIRKLIVFIIVLAIFIPYPLLGGEKVVYPCVSETAKLMSMKSTWDEIFNAAIALPPACYDGYFAEGISDTLIRKMAQDWNGFLCLISQHRKDTKFMNLILESINATLDDKDIRTVERLARTHCRGDLRNTCRIISNRAVIVLSTYDSPETHKGPKP